MNRWVVTTLIALTAISGWPSCTQPGSEMQSEVTSLPEDAGIQYIYGGNLPALDRPAIALSTRAQTIRVTGFLPKGWTDWLPYYVYKHQRPTDGQYRISVVYPALANPACLTPATHTQIVAFPSVPKSLGGGDARWTAFPYLQFGDNEAQAIHGPLTHLIGRSFLVRGPNSQGCVRMQGEHLVEAAHLIGLDLQTVYARDWSAPLPVRVAILSDWDYIEGVPVDVDFPAAKNVQRPPHDKSMLRPIWDPSRLIRWACVYRANRPLNDQHCHDLPPNRWDPATGATATPAQLRQPATPAPTSTATQECPPEHELVRFGSDGGSYCLSGDKFAMGPFTQRMISECVELGFVQHCNASKWPKALLLATRGLGRCPAGSAFDPQLESCVEGSFAFGPFGKSLIDACLRSQYPEKLCRAMQWNVAFIKGLKQQTERTDKSYP